MRLYGPDDPALRTLEAIGRADHAEPASSQIALHPNVGKYL